MTCIVGIAQGGKVYIGADSAGSDGWNVRIRADRKVFKNGELIFGFTSSFRMGQLLQFNLTPPPIHEGQDAYKYAVTQLVPAIRDTLRFGGYMKTTEGRETGGTFLVGFRGHLFRIDGDFQVGESRECYESVGCGDCYAMGAMHAQAALPPIERLKAGLEAAATFSVGVAAPFNFIELDAPTAKGAAS
jgi:ATP-dependent protease HslVU (ClpYQ) peptidase subunit